LSAEKAGMAQGNEGRVGGEDSQALSPSKSSFFLNKWGGVRKSTTGRLLRGKTMTKCPLSMFRTFHKGKLDYLRLRRGKTE